MIEIIVTGIIIVLAVLILVKQFKKKIKGECSSCSGNCSCCSSHKTNDNKENDDK